jgi:rubrerythrin
MPRARSCWFFVLTRELLRKVRHAAKIKIRTLRAIVARCVSGANYTWNERSPERRPSTRKLNANISRLGGEPLEWIGRQIKSPQRARSKMNKTNHNTAAALVKAKKCKRRAPVQILIQNKTVWRCKHCAQFTPSAAPTSLSLCKTNST